MAVTAQLDACRNCTESDGARGRDDEFSGSDTLDRLEAPCPTEIVALRVRTVASLVSVRLRDDASTSVIRLGPGLTCGGVVDERAAGCAVGDDMFLVPEVATDPQTRARKAELAAGANAFSRHRHGSSRQFAVEVARSD